MEESSSQEPTDKSLPNSVDLSALKSFSFGTEWSQSSKSSDRGSSARSDRNDSRKSRPDRRPGNRSAPNRDRRPTKRKFDGPSGGDGERGDSSRPPFEGGGRGQRGGGRRMPAPPYESPVFAVSFYPEDTSFATIIKAMRSNHLTYELFEVSKIFLDKSDRFIASITCKPKGDEKSPKVHVSVPDGMPFATEEEAVTHAVANALETFFTVEEVEVEAPSGNFPFVNRCSITKVLLGPPNYHKYELALRNHHSTRLSHLPFEKVQASVETVREEEAINEWLESMKKASRYVSKLVEEGQEPKIFNSIEEASFYLKSEHKSKVVKTVNYARVGGVELEKFNDTEAFKAMNGELLRQRRFPLDTANSIRGRMRREKFSIYKKGAKGVTFVCATKRNFRVPGQVMAESLDRIMRFLDDNAKIKQKEMGTVYEEWLKKDAPSEAFDDKKMLRDLHWLIADGYVSHFSDDSLLAQPVMTNAPASEKKPAHAKSDSAAKEVKAVVAETVEPKAEATSVTTEAPVEEVTAPAVEAETVEAPSEEVATPVVATTETETKPTEETSEVEAKSEDAASAEATEIPAVEPVEDTTSVSDEEPKS